MPFVTVTSSGTTSGQDCVTCASTRLRGLLSTTGNDATILLSFTNEVQQELNRHTRWQFLKSSTQSFTTVVGEESYHIGTGATPSGATDLNLDLSDINTIDENSVFDRTNYAQLTRIAERPLSAEATTQGYPKWYRHDPETPTLLQIYPPPNGAYTIEFRYYAATSEVTGLADILQIPDRYADVVCNGVTARAYAFLKMPEDAAMYQALYEKGMTQMVSDRHLFPKSADYIRPGY